MTDAPLLEIRNVKKILSDTKNQEWDRSGCKSSRSGQSDRKSGRDSGTRWRVGMWKIYIGKGNPQTA